MKNTRLYLMALLALSVMASCSKSQVAGDWSIPQNEVLDGGVGKDGIPSVDNPNFVEVANVESYLTDTDLVMVAKVGSEVHIYPHPILDWHEIINDEIDNEKFAVTYCPLTGTGIGWNRMIDGEETTFGVSGLLYNSNLIPYDRKTNSNWSQIRLDCVNGDLEGRQIELFPLLETEWGIAKAMFPNADVVSTNTGFNRSYGTYPYGGYRTNGSINFPISNVDERLQEKERVLALVNGANTVVYRFKNFEGNENKVLEDNFDGKPIVLFGNEGKNFIAAFESTVDGQQLNFTATNTSNTAIVATDDSGSEWNVFGEAVSGPNTGKQLKSLQPSFIAYWFSIGAFYEGAEIK